MENSFPLHSANLTCGFLPCDMKASALLAGYLQCLILCIFIHTYLIAKGHWFSLCPGHFHIALPLLTQFVLEYVTAEARLCHLVSPSPVSAKSQVTSQQIKVNFNQQQFK